MKQNSGDKRCVAVVVGMVLKEDPKLFESWCNHPAPYSEIEMARYLFDRGYFTGLALNRDYFYNVIDVSDSNEPNDVLFVPKFELNAETTIDMSFKLKDFPAIFIVESDSEGMETHAIFWDNKALCILDPNPMTKNGRDLSSYRIVSYFPIFNIGAK